MRKEWAKFVQRIHKKGGERYMKKIIALALVAVMVGSTYLPYAYAIDPVPYNKTTTVINYIWDSKGVLTGQSQFSTSKGYTNTGGDAYNYDVTTTMNFTVLNGKAYASGYSSTENRKNADGAESTIITNVTYKRDANGCLMGTTGTRTTNGYTEQIDACSQEIKKEVVNGVTKWYYTDENNVRHDLTLVNVANTDGTTDDANAADSNDYFNEKADNKDVRVGAEFRGGKFYAPGGKITSSDPRNYYVENTTLTFAIINGQAEVVGETSKRTVYDVTKANILSYTESTTTRSYAIQNGVTRLVDVETQGVTWDYTSGTLDGGTTVGNPDIKNPASANLPYQTFISKTHYAYDAKGNVLPSKGLVKDSNNKIYVDANNNGIVDAGDTEVVDRQNAGTVGTIADELLEILKAQGGSYSLTETKSFGPGSTSLTPSATTYEITYFTTKGNNGTGPYLGYTLPKWTWSDTLSKP